MKRLSKNRKAFLICTGIALVVHLLAGYVLFQVDLLEAIARRAQGPLMALTLLVFARAYLYFIVPGWAMYLAACLWLERREKKTGQEKVLTR